MMISKSLVALVCLTLAQLAHGQGYTAINFQAGYFAPGCNGPALFTGPAVLDACVIDPLASTFVANSTAYFTVADGIVTYTQYEVDGQLRCTTSGESTTLPCNQCVPLDPAMSGGQEVDAYVDCLRPIVTLRQHNDSECSYAPSSELPVETGVCQSDGGDGLATASLDLETGLASIEMHASGTACEGTATDTFSDTCGECFEIDASQNLFGSMACNDHIPGSNLGGDDGDDDDDDDDDDAPSFSIPSNDEPIECVAFVNDDTTTVCNEFLAGMDVALSVEAQAHYGALISVIQLDVEGPANPRNACPQTGHDIPEVLEYLCHYAFQPCQVNALTSNVVPRSPCRSDCEYLFETCVDLDEMLIPMAQFAGHVLEANLLRAAFYDYECVDMPEVVDNSFDGPVGCVNVVQDVASSDTFLVDGVFDAAAISATIASELGLSAGDVAVVEASGMVTVTLTTSAAVPSDWLAQLNLLVAGGVVEGLGLDIDPLATDDMVYISFHFTDCSEVATYEDAIPYDTCTFDAEIGAGGGFEYVWVTQVGDTANVTFYTDSNCQAAGGYLELPCEQCAVIDDGQSIPGILITGTATNCDANGEYIPSSYNSAQQVDSPNPNDDDNDDDDDSGNDGDGDGDGEDDGGSDNTIIIIVVVVAVLAIGGGIAFFVMRNKDKNLVTKA